MQATSRDRWSGKEGKDLEAQELGSINQHEAVKTNLRLRSDPASNASSQ